MDDPKKVMNEGSEGLLEEAMLESMVGGDVSAPIYRQEARGQASLVTSDQLPVDGSPGSMKFGRPLAREVEEAWVATGIEFGPVEDGEIFRNAMLPEGWKKVPTDHSMWSHLVDDKGRVRARIFYKAAFYDRSAHVDMDCRFRVRAFYDPDLPFDDKDSVKFEVTDCEKVVFTSKEIKVGKRPSSEENRARSASDEWYEAMQMADIECRKECEAWLAEQGFEDYKHPGKYWD